MTWYVYLMTDSRRSSLHCGRCRDIRKAVSFFEQMPTLFFTPPARQNILVYVEIWTDEKAASERFEQMTRLRRSEKEALVASVNPDWQEMKPGINIEV